jgi:hypothetical protein
MSTARTDSDIAERVQRAIHAGGVLARAGAAARSAVLARLAEALHAREVSSQVLG